ERSNVFEPIGVRARSHVTERGSVTRSSVPRRTGGRARMAMPMLIGRCSGSQSRAPERDRRTSRTANTRAFTLRYWGRCDRGADRAPLLNAYGAPAKNSSSRARRGAMKRDAHHFVDSTAAPALAGGVPWRWLHPIARVGSLLHHRGPMGGP